MKLLEQHANLVSEEMKPEILEMEGEMKIEILGDGCFLCGKMYENVLEALRLSEKEADVIKTMEIRKIAGSQVMAMPAMIIDGVVKVSGKVPTVTEILEWIA